jgi:hypothetical protein
MMKSASHIAKEILPDNSKIFGSPNYFLKHTNTHTHKYTLNYARAKANAKHTKKYINQQKPHRSFLTKSSAAFFTTPALSPRHCEQSEAIQLLLFPGLLRTSQ